MNNILLSFWAITLLWWPPRTPPKFHSISSFAVVELFTAEGCSSCPPADKLLEEMSCIMRKEGKNVIPLSFHVTYWNNYGWNDIYSKEIFTERQKEYQIALQLTDLYTPQAIVNGEHEFAGSNPIAFRQFVAAAAAQHPVYSIDAQTNFDNDTMRISYQLNKAPNHLKLNVALVEDHVEHFVSEGENKNKTIQHINTVREFRSMEPAIKDTIKLGWPVHLPKNNSSIILYLQNPASMKIVAACCIK